MAQKRITFISFDEFKKIYRAAREDKKLQLAILLGFGSGLRISEIIGLEAQFSRCCNAEIKRIRKQVNGKNRRIIICSNCGKTLSLKELKRRKGVWEIPPLTKENINLAEHKINLEVAKGGKWRTTVTSPILMEKKLKYLPIKIPRRTLQYRFSALTQKILNKKMSFHVLRHGFGNYQVNVLKTPLPIVQQLMGHSRLDTTGIYTRANPEYAIQTAWKGMTGEE